MTHVDDINVGEFIVVTKWLLYEEYDDSTFPPRRNPIPMYTGQPHEVVGIGLPFLSLRDKDGDISTLDTRAFAFQKVPKDYMQSVLDKDVESINHGKLLKQEPKLQESKEKLCPLCQQTLQERQVMGESKWQWVCRPCGFVGYIDKELAKQFR